MASLPIDADNHFYEPLFRAQIAEGVDPRSSLKVEPLRSEYRDRDQRIRTMDEQGLGAALLCDERTVQRIMHDNCVERLGS